MQQLGVQISTKELYQKLLKYFNPENFMEPYDFEAVQKANDYYASVEEYRNDIGELERLREEVIRNVTLRGYYWKVKELKRKKREKEAAEEEEENRIALIWIGSVICFVVIMIIVLANINV